MHENGHNIVIRTAPRGAVHRSCRAMGGAEEEHVEVRGSRTGRSSGSIPRMHACARSSCRVRSSGAVKNPARKPATGSCCAAWRRCATGPNNLGALCRCWYPQLRTLFGDCIQAGCKWEGAEIGHAVVSSQTASEGMHSCPPQHGAPTASNRWDR